MRRAVLWARKWGAWALAGLLGLVCLVAVLARRRAPAGVWSALQRLRLAQEEAALDDLEIRVRRDAALEAARQERADTEREIVAAETARAEELARDPEALDDALDARLRELGLEPKEHRR